MSIQSYKDKYNRYIKFIKKYREASNASTGSEVDSNANVDNKNVTTCTGELYKRDAIGINRLQMINKITELYGEDLASEYIRQLDSHEIYRHDETNPLLPYTYGSKELVNIKYNDKSYSVSMEELYDLCLEPETLVDSEQIVYNKQPKNMFVLDKNGYTSVLNLFKKKCHKELVKVNTTDGRTIIVTEDHPMIVSDDFESTVPANEALRKNIYETYCDNAEFVGKKYGEEISSSKPELALGYDIGKALTNEDNEEYAVAITVLNSVLEYNEDFASGILDGIMPSLSTIQNRSLYLKIKNLLHILRRRKSEWIMMYKIDPVSEKDKNDNEYIYDISTESHTFICNGLWVHNCVSITMYPYLFHGTTNIGGNSEAPKHLDSFCGSFINLVYAVASQFAGAIATPEFLMYMDYFIRKDYGDDYYLHPEKIVSMGVNPKSLENLIENKFQQVVYTINDPAGSRNFQSVFWNIAYFDHPYFNGIFEDFVFPDGTEPKWESTNWLQKKFMKWFNKERLKKILTFPVETVNLLSNGEDCVDTEWRDFAAEMWSEGASFFCYNSDSVDALASCCYGADTKVLVKRSGKVVLATLKEISSWKTKNNLYVLSNGEWKKAKFVELPNERTMYCVEFKNGSSLVMTDNHRNNCVDGMKYTKDLKIGDYVEVASKPIETDGAKLNEILSRIDDEDRMLALRAMIGSIDSSDLVNEDKRYTKVVRISIVEYNEPFVYCFEMEDKENDKFTLANGIHNYNCRLKNAIQSNVFSYTLGAGGLMTGSKGVITININRLVQNVAKEHGGKENITLNDISARISEQVSKLHKYMTAYNEILKDSYNARMLPVYDADYISLEKQYLTMGVC